MDIANISQSDKEPLKYEELYCSANLTGNKPSIAIAVSVNVLLSITAILGNTLIFVALNKVSSLHPTSKILFYNLVTTDLLVGLVSQPMIIIYWMSLINEARDFCRSVFVLHAVSSYVLCGMSLLITTSISVDRLLALSLELRYHQVVTKRRTCVLLTTLWAISIVFSTLFVKNNQLSMTYTHVITFLCLTISTISYNTIFVKLRLRRNQVEVFEGSESNCESQSSQLRITRYKKALSSALWLQITLIICYTPYGVLLLLAPNESAISVTVVLSGRITKTLVFLNSSLNPILYCWKLREIRQVVKSTTQKLLYMCW
ncbi:melanocortin receptor 4-like [Montipora capricornis]|uniref:melanocortin receptor 4-like n=1 Tax=Montipora capricornis TaxID=246305 RepID=UPI0035F11776